MVTLPRPDIDWYLINQRINQLVSSDFHVLSNAKRTIYSWLFNLLHACLYRCSREDTYKRPVHSSNRPYVLSPKTTSHPPSSLSLSLQSNSAYECYTNKDRCETLFFWCMHSLLMTNLRSRPDNLRSAIFVGKKTRLSEDYLRWDEPKQSWMEPWYNMIWGVTLIIDRK